MPPMQVLRLLARRAVPTTITAPAPPSESEPEADEDEGPFFDLDFSSSVRASSSSSAGTASSASDDAFTDLDFIISLHRTRSSASPPSYDAALFLLKPCCASEPRAKSPGGPRALSMSFGAGRRAAAALYGGRPSLARSSSSSARSLRLFMESPADDDGDEPAEKEPRRAAAPHPSSNYSGDAIRRYLASISRRLRLRKAGAGAGTLRRLRKSRSASAAVSSASRRDDSAAEKQDGIASAIAHCKESLSLHHHRVSLSLSEDCHSSPLPRSRSDPSSCETRGGIAHS